MTCATRLRALRLPLLLLAALLWSAAAAAAGLVGGTYNEFDVELPQNLRKIAGHGQPSHVTHALVTIAVPKNIDMAREWPVLVVSATSDVEHHSSRALLRAYADVAVANGWIAIAADPKEQVLQAEDDVPLRLALNAAALAVLARQWPGTDRSPLAFGGFSGGAKYSERLAAAFAKEGRKVVGIYLAGIDEDELVAAAARLELPAAFKLVPVFLQAGDRDEVAPLADHQAISAALKSAGFRNVRLVSFAGAHVVEPALLQVALEWFRDYSAVPVPGT
jgi:predicted esterase